LRLEGKNLISFVPKLRYIENLPDISHYPNQLKELNSTLV
jgi:hypothetical protein